MQYISKQKDASQYLSDLREKKPAFKQFLDLEETCCGSKLDNLLKIPVITL
jgi:hypothetical protein